MTIGPAEETLIVRVDEEQGPASGGATRPSRPPAPGEGPPVRAPQGTRRRAEEVLHEFHDEIRLGRAYDARLIRRLWPFVHPHQRLLWLALGVSVLAAAAALTRPLVMRWAVDSGVTAGNVRILTQAGLVLTGVVLVEQFFVFVQTYCLQVAGARAMADLRRHVFRFLHQMRLSYFDRQPVGRLVTRVTNDTDAVLELFASGVLNAFGDLVRLLGILVILFVLDPRLALVAFAAVPPAVVLLALLRRLLRQAFRDVRAKTAQMNANMDEQVSGMSVVQAFRRERAAEREFDLINSAYRDANLLALKYESMQDAAIDMVLSIAIASIVVLLGYQPVGLGTLVAFNLYIFLFFEPISALSQRYTLLQSAMAGAERVFTLLDTPGEKDAPVGVPEPNNGAFPSPFPQEAAERGGGPARVRPPAFAFEGVTFAYKPNVPVLSDVSFTVEPGEKVSLVGPTGAGKSTIAQLLLRLYDCQQGRVFVGGRDTRSWDPSELRRQFAVVPQDVYLFPGTLADNIAIGESPDLERVRQALERIGAYDLFAQRQGGLHAPVEERGGNYSAGERQLIAFARALYRDSPYLILDEATASVDSDTEARLRRAVAELLRGRAALTIAHRLSTIRAADRILVIHHGRIVESGKHSELMARGGLYARLYELQGAAERQTPVAT